MPENIPKRQDDCRRAQKSYEPPQATVVPVQLEERVLGCNFSTIQNCGLTE